MQLTISIKNEAAVKRMIQQAPSLAADYLTKGLHAAILRLHAISQDSAMLAFKNPTHTTRLSFGRGITLRPLYASIRPMTEYSPFVHEGTKYIKANPFMDRIARVGQLDVNKEVNAAMDQLIKNL